MDLGSGKEWLRELLPPGCTYIAVDYKDRGTGNLVHDFNEKDFPPITSDYAFISGCLEYMEDPAWFVAQVCKAAQNVIISYNTTELVGSIAHRKELAWKNHFSEKEITGLFSAGGMVLAETDRTVHKNTIFVFRKK
jgi:hypothetical protein